MNNTIFDDVFRTMLEKMPRLVIPLINEVFHTAYPEDIQIVQKRNEHETKNGEVITDSHLLIGRRIYHLECQSTDDSTMILRMIEYDFAIGLEYAEKGADGRFLMRFPHSCVLYLRGSARQDHMEMDLVFPDGRKVPYRVPVIQMEAYTSDVIFQKHLLFLLPFYIIRYEKSQAKIAKDAELFRALMAEYAGIERHLEAALLEKDREKDFRDLIELIGRIADYIFAESDTLKKGLGDIMGGKVLELESDRLIARGKREGISEGLEKGKQQGLSEGLLKGKQQGVSEGRTLQSKKIALKMHQQGYDIPSIANLLEIPPETVTQWISL